MATYYVNNTSGNNGNAGTASGSPWKTLTYAATHVSSGDTINLQTSEWNEQLNITTPNTTWQAQTGHTPVIDGNYHDGLFGQHGAAAGNLPPPPRVPGNVAVRFESLVFAGAANVTVKGLTVQNSGGEGIGIGAFNGIKVRDCLIDFTYNAGISVGDLGANDPKRAGLEITGNIISRSTWCFYDPLRYWKDWSGVGAKDYRGEVVSQTMKISCTTGALIADNVGAYSAGEGIDLGKGNVNLIFENNISFGHRHYHVYLMYSRDTTVRRNIVFWPQNQPKPNEGPPNPPGGIGIRDESSGLDKGFSIQSGAFIYNNLVIGLGHPFGVAGSSSESAVERLYVGFNTFVGGPKTDKGVVFSPSVSGKHSGIIENNVIDYGPAPAAVPVAQGGKDNLVFRNNCWSKAAPADFRGANDQTGSPRLANPAAAVTGQNATGVGIPSNTFNKLNYQLTGSSTLCIGKASNGSAAGGVTPPNITTDILGASRDAGVNRDLGAFEYGGVVVDSVSANFSQAPSTGTTPLTVQFTDASTVTGAAVINSWSWAFGDGGTATTPSPSHIYSTAGTYQATLTVQDTVRGKTSTYVGPNIVVGTTPPDNVTANFTQSPSSGVAPLSVQFVDTSTATGNAVIDSWSWDFGDGGVSTNPSPLHVYTTPGTYQALLIVEDTGLGKTSSKFGPVITVSTVTSNVTANFSHAPSGGQAPLTVNFSDTSTVTGSAVINAWEWTFGDGGTATTQNPSHVYTAAGVYTPTLTVRDTTRNLVDTKAGAAIVVTTDMVAGSVTLRQVRTALNTSDGNQTFTQAGLGGLIPKSAVIRVTKATADGVAADGELLAVGFVTGAANQVACAIATDHNAAVVNAARRWTDNACILLIDGSGAVVLRATFVGFVADGVTLALDWTGAGTAYLATVEFGAGPDYRAWAGVVELGAVNTSVDITAPGFAPDAGRFAATWGARDEAAPDATISLGLAHRTGPMFCLERHAPDGQPDAMFYSRLNNDQVAQCRYNAQGRARVTPSAWDGQGVTLSVVTDDVNSSLLVLLEQYGAGSVVGQLTAPTATGAVDYALPWNPQYVTHLMSPRIATGSANAVATAGSMGVHSATADGEFSDTVAGEQSAATTNEQSLSDNRLVLTDHAGATLAAGDTTLGTARYTIDWTTAATAMLWPYLAVEEGSTGGTPIAAEFVGTPLVGVPPLTVAFTDLTGGATSWAWDFGDGTTSAEQNPTHTYTADGVYDVSLTASDGVNVDTETKGGYVVATTEGKRVVIIGPYLLKPLTATSAQETTWPGEDENVERGTVSGELALDFLPLKADAAEPPSLGAELRVWFDGTALKAKLPDGTVKTITWT